MADTARELALQVAAEFFAVASKEGTDKAAAHIQSALRAARNDALGEVINNVILSPLVAWNAGEVIKAIRALKDRT